MHLVLISNFTPDRRANSEHGYHLYDALRAARPDARITVLAGTVHPVLREPSHVLRAWRHDSVFLAHDMARAVARLRPQVVIVNASFNAWGNDVANLLGFWAIRSLARRVPTVALLHYLPQTLDLSRTGYRIGPLRRFGIDVACRLAACATMAAFTLQRDQAYFARHYKPQGTVHMPLGFLGFTSDTGWNEDDDRPTLLAFGHWGPGKDLEPLLQAVDATPSVRLIVAGASHPRFPGFLEAIRARHPSPRIEWTGYVDEAELPALFRRARLVVLPYARDTGTSAVLHQACQTGRAILASDIGVLRAEAARLGVQVDFYQDATQLATRLAAAHDAPRLLAEGQYNLEVVRRDWTTVGARWWQLLEGLDTRGARS